MNKKNSIDKVPNPLSSANSKAVAVNRLEEEVRVNLPASAADVAAALQQRRPPVYHHHHHEQQQQQRQSQATAVPGVFNFNPMMGAGMMGGGPYNPGAAAAGMNYFHPGMPPPFVLPANSSVPPAAAKRGGATATAAPTASSPGKFPVHLGSSSSSGGKRKSSAANSTAAERSKKKQRLPSSQSTTTEALLIDLTAQQEQEKTKPTNTTTTTTKSSSKPTAPRDPPGFEAFQRDPSFITSIMESRMKENGNSDRLLGPLARGIINMSDEEIFKLSNDENDSSMRTFVTDVIMPLLGIDDHIAQSNYQVWQGYAHISSDSLTSLAKNFFYVRRSSMKAAVQVAFFEMKKNHQKLLRAQAAASAAGGYQQNAASNSAAVAAAAVSARKIQQLELALKHQQKENAKMTKQIEEIYENDIADMRKDHKLHVEELKDAHRKEVKALKEEMEDMKCSHREFLGHYVEAAAEALRFAKKEGKPSSSSLGRAISDL
eukprot:CAMPEP_0201700282 /NCGR_PEP_ID=MMETSP0578-20130828/27929_1 /ASSEMBLY_ACC=CAM_ASM_000663 /TAXON_ID=267565 /ORGANISM="Skeletonema grethea, Strain CCMP 1804" /LENGTH=487 /DNA_ID=CAMNT_0048187297 /DNA_START=36 /DNA_END=1499 /DNA_ORIENTATION=+